MKARLTREELLELRRMARCGHALAYRALAAHYTATREQKRRRRRSLVRAARRIANAAFASRRRGGRGGRRGERTR